MGLIRARLISRNGDRVGVDAPSDPVKMQTKGADMIKRYIRIAAIVLGGFAAAPAAQAQQPALPPLPDEVAAQFPAIGRLGQAGFRTKQGCTATLIAPHIILTAAHCLSPTGTSERVFVAGWSRGDYIDFSQTGLEMRHPAFGMGGRNSPNLDIGFAVLDTPITTVAPANHARAVSAIPVKERDDAVLRLSLRPSDRTHTRSRCPDLPFSH